MGIATCPAMIGQRVAFEYAAQLGQSVARAAGRSEENSRATVPVFEAMPKGSGKGEEESESSIHNGFLLCCHFACRTSVRSECCFKPPF